MIFLFLNFIFVSFVAHSQDLNQTNTDYSPMYLNPALTGHFLGDIRTGANYRDQGKYLIGKGYTTLNLYIDAPVSISWR